MMNIEKFEHIDRTKLDEALYLPSLIEQANILGLMSEDEIATLQIATLELLSDKIEKFTNGESSSVPTETAGEIMTSNIYTIGIYLKSFSSPDEALQMLKEHSVAALYSSGSRRIRTKLKALKHLYYLVLNNLIETTNIAYNSTIVDEINRFFKLYNPDFEATKINITCDYPLCNPVNGLLGIEFVDRYLKSIYYENLFCKLFSSVQIEKLLYSYDEHQEDLIFNIFEQVLTCAIGCVIAKVDVKQLLLTAFDADKIHSILHEKSKKEIDDIVYESFNILVLQLELTNSSLQKYILQSLPSIAARIFAVSNAKKDVIIIK